MSENPTSGPVEENAPEPPAGETDETIEPTPGERASEQAGEQAQRVEHPPVAAPAESLPVAAQPAEAAPAIQPPVADDATRLDLDPVLSAAPAAAAPQAAPEEQEEPDVAPKKKRRGAKVAAWTVFGAVVVAGGAYTGAAFLTQDKLPAHLSVDGIDLSGQSAEHAKTTLSEQLLPRAQKALKLTAGEQSVALKPAEAGLGVDVDATVDRFTGLSWDPSVILSRIVGSQDAQAVTTVDEQALTGAVDKAAKSLSTAPVEGSIVVAQGKADYNEPRDGVAIDAAATATSLKEQWLHADGSIAATSSTQAPAVSAADWKGFLDASVQPLLDGPITVNNGSAEAQLPAATVGAAATVAVKDGKPALTLDGEKLVAAVVEVNPKMASEGRNATVKMTGSGASASLSVVPAQEGKGIDAATLAAAVQKASTESSRKATVELQVTQPTISTKTAESWNMVKVAEFATPYPTYDTVRTKNLRLGASRVNGTVVDPGKEFNLADQFGPITTANGYVASGVVENGNATTALGGGISQISTMSYNAGFLGGMDILEHKPHSRWFDRYPAGRESTYWEGQVNMRWKNNTKAPVVVQMWVTDSQVKTVLWGVKTWDVKTTTSDHYNITSPTTVHSSAAKCQPESGGKSGFTVTVTRSRTSAEKSLPKESFVWTYSPWNRIVCDK
ncbi:VanW family protein [Galactobacter valiniphilus]|uniref:VanW family protein n=1 Tax=Galactobacter valiniphilus TaxID=2676122 RepID=UPI0037354931